MSDEVYNIETSKKNIEIKDGDDIYKINIRIKYKKLDNYLKADERGVDYQTAFDELIGDNETNIKNLSIENKNLIIDKIIEEYALIKYEEQINSKDNFEKLYKMLSLYTDEKLKEIGKTFEHLSDAIKRIVQTISELNIASRIEKTLKQFQEFGNNILESFQELDVSLNERIENHKKWAEYGWTIIPQAPINFFDDAPETQEEADEKCLNIIDNNEVQNLLEYLLKNINQKEKLEEAINCYNQEYYVATAMMLTALIERNLTELPMPDPTIEKPKKNLMINNFQEALKKDESGVIKYFYLNNLFEYIEKLFEHGHGFVDQKYNINRNFLMHGWRDVETTKIDCIKLILALYNILFLWEHK